MRNDQNSDSRNNQHDMNENRFESSSSRSNDLPDNPRDARELQPEETYIDLPDVKDIPGQEFVHVPHLDAIGDTTVSSDDEEGTRVFDQDDDEALDDSDEVGNAQRVALSRSGEPDTIDAQNLRDARMDSTDFQGEGLNEASFGQEKSGKDLDQ